MKKIEKHFEDGIILKLNEKGGIQSHVFGCVKWNIEYVPVIFVKTCHRQVVDKFKNDYNKINTYRKGLRLDQTALCTLS